MKSTMTPGTTAGLQEMYQSNTLLFNPEFLTEKNAKDDFINQNRIIIGEVNPGDGDAVVDMFKDSFHSSVRVFSLPSTEAELVKYVTNNFLSMKLSFANEIYDLCQHAGLDYTRVYESAKLDKRLGDSHWGVPGHDGDRGFGGHCFPKDLNAMIYMFEELGLDATMLKATRDKNDMVRKNRD